ncbi:MAG: zinc metallopeptidase [Ruminococcaceae bacterium]|nr:zinc metallopeptidase [Oscillospiraceae bacterium]
MPYYFYGIDPLYLYLVLPAILLSLFAQIKVKSTFSKYSKFYCNYTGAQAATRVLESNGVYNVKIERVAGNLTDHYDPKTNVIRLSDAVYDSTSISAVGVAAHEAGHAVQYANAYAPIKIRTALYPICNLGSQLSMPLILIGLLFNFSFLMDLGIIFFGVALVFQLVTLPVEFNASSRAITSLSQSSILLDEGEIKGAKKVLSAAALTYIAAFLVSLTQLLRFLIIANRRRR